MTMAPNERARQHHAALFPNHVSALATTDPELVDVFDNFAFDEVRSALLAALGGCDPQVKGHVAANLPVGNDRKRLIDVVTQLLPFIGYPRTLNALRAIDEVVPA